MTVYEEIKDQVVFITGGTQGIGAGMVRAFTNQGAKVVVNGRKLNEKVQTLLDETLASAAMGDIGNTEDAIRIVMETEEKFGPIDTLICNAAGMRMKPFLEQGEEDWWDQINTNLTGHIACIQTAINGMKKNGGGTIIIISSFFGTIGWKNASGYGSSKSGLLTLGQYLSKAYRKDNIRVGIIVPGVIDTPQLNVDATDLGITLKEVHEMYAAEIPMARIGTPSEIAELAVFMSTEGGGSALNGRHIQVSGGEYRTTPYYV